MDWPKSRALVCQWATGMELPKWKEHLIRMALALENPLGCLWAVHVEYFRAGMGKGTRNVS